MSQQIQFRRGPESNRTGIVFEQGEPVWTTDNKRLNVGDGSTYGGIPIGGLVVTGMVIHPSTNLGSGIFWSYNPNNIEIANLEVKMIHGNSSENESAFHNKSATFHRADDNTLLKIGNTTTLASHTNSQFGMDMIISGDQVRIIVNNNGAGGENSLWIAKIERFTIGELLTINKITD